MAGGRKKPSALPADDEFGKQVVFRVKNPLKQPKIPRQSRPRQEKSQSLESGNHTRKAHRKSKTGCLNCRQRRIKCDETRPQCQKCETYGVDCDYSASVTPPSASDSLPSDRSSSPEISRYVQSMSAADIAARIDQTLDHTPALDLGIMPLPQVARARSYAVFYHFIQFLSDVDSPVSQSLLKVIRGDMLRLALQTPYLMHAVLGIATFHLAGFSLDPNQSKVAHVHHLSYAISLYQRQLRYNINRDTMDGLMSTCMLLANTVFLEDRYYPSKSFVFSSDPTALNWLRIQSGMQYILPYVGEWFGESIWFVPFMEQHYAPPMLDDSNAGYNELHPGLAEICEIDERSTEKDNPYLRPLRMLCLILKTEVNAETFAKLATFMGRITPDFINLLQRKEPRALLILAFWLGKMCEQKSNWMYPRFYAECTAICMFLENSSDRRVLELLMFPAQKCDYRLWHAGDDLTGIEGGSSSDEDFIIPLGPLLEWSP